MQGNQHLAPPCFQQFHLPAIPWAHGGGVLSFHFLCGFWKVGTEEEENVMSSLQTKRAIYLTKTPFV